MFVSIMPEYAVNEPVSLLSDFCGEIVSSVGITDLEIIRLPQQLINYSSGSYPSPNTIHVKIAVTRRGVGKERTRCDSCNHFIKIERKLAGVQIEFCAK